MTVLDDLSEHEEGCSNGADFRETWTRLMARARVLLQSSAPPTPPASSPPSNDVPKLPHMELPKFRGNYDEWPHFQAVFTSLIHANQQLSDLQRFYYLQGALEGEPKALLKTIQFSEAAYMIAWNKLRERYHNERVIIRKHIHLLLTLSEVKRDNSASLRHQLDTVSLQLAALRALKRSVDHWDDLLVEIVASKLDHQLRKEWEGKFCDTIPQYSDLESFLSNKCRQLEAMRDPAPTPKETPPPSRPRTVAVVNSSAPESRTETRCQPHMTFRCYKLFNAPVEQRLNWVSAKKLCFNCLRPDHDTASCTSATCRKCQERHHTLLHRPTAPPAPCVPSSEGSPSPPAAIVGNIQGPTSTVLLSTCIAEVSARGTSHEVRMLLDTDLISEACVHRLGLKTQGHRTDLHVAGGSTTRVTRLARLDIRSRASAYATSLHAYVMPSITPPTPSRRLDDVVAQLPSNLTLADPTFHVPGPIDILIGNALMYDLLTEGTISIARLRLQNTVFGWVLGGATCNPAAGIQLRSNHVRLADVVAQFWTMESISGCSPHIKHDPCDSHFDKHVERLPDGRYQVALPFKEDPLRLGDSSMSARRSFLALERRLQRNPPLYERYRSFMDEYLQLQHMVPIQCPSSEGYYLPHHCVLKEASLTTKLRVVFNASAPSNNGVSLNDILMTGRKQQDELFDIILRFRMRQFVLTADITKMYRQVAVRPSDTRYQRIWWRRDAADQLQTYELTTVTYGMAPASYLAIRALRETAHNAAAEYPRGAQRVLEDFYVDDLLTGADQVSELELIRDEIIAVLETSKFMLNKWASNCPQVLRSVAALSSNAEHLIQAPDTNVSALGTIWHPIKDEFSFQSPTTMTPVRTKRSLLSELCKVYDPLGLIGPVIITAKILMQDLWRLKVGWDEPLPAPFHERWIRYAASLQQLHLLKVPRKVIPDAGLRVELHGFADASESAFGACVYLVTFKEDHPISSRLLCAKSRVAPLKTVSIPRLELSAALLLAELSNSLKMPSVPKYYYTDSSIALTWIQSESRSFKVFVANRVGEIQRLTKPSEWAHVSTDLNPADVISRGAELGELLSSELWWFGPPFLMTGERSTNFLPVESVPELKCHVATPINDSLRLSSTYGRTLRIYAYVNRFLLCTRRRELCTGPPSIPELRAARNLLLRSIQRSSFREELEELRTTTHAAKTRLASLNPFLDDDQILRVGGRLRASPLPYDARCPILLPAHHDFTKLLIMHFHLREMHAGTQGTLAAMRQEFWPLSGRSSVRGMIRKCLRCRRARPANLQPIMSDLPNVRLKAARPFLNTGVDYAGPFMIKDGSTRARRIHKSYACLFVCMSTKAVHIELVSNLTTDAFFAALHRFVARRGIVKHIYSDNGRNFLGARNQLHELGKFLGTTSHQLSIAEQMTLQGIQWTFTPPYAPHFGGLWEAGVKSMKHHMQRVAGNASMTFEELSTLLSQIEAVLNSRPITPLSADPNDLAALTPGHFLIGEPLTSIPTAPLADVGMNRLSRWQLVERQRQDIWRRWHKEYLSELHQRTKWRQPAPNAEIGNLVLIREDNLPPLEWRLARIIALHPGKDGVVRVVTLRTALGLVKRSVTKLCPLLD